MAQTGFTPILLYASGTASAAPTAGNLTSSASGAELALNYADGKLFYKDSGGVVQTLATKATGTIGGSTTQVQYNNGGVLAGSANLTFDGTSLTLGGNPTLSAGTANGVLYLNGSKVATSGSALTFDGTDLATTGGVRLNNAQYYYGKSAAGSAVRLLGVNAGNVNYVGSIDSGPTEVNYGAASTITAQYWNISGSEQMRLTSTGLGIGTSSPQNKLVVSNAGAQGFEFDPSTGIFQVYNRGTSAYGEMRPYASLIRFFTGSSPAETMRLDSSGNLLLGTTSTGADGLGISNLLNLTFPEGSGTSYANLFRQTSSAATILSNGYKRSATASGFASSVGTSWAKTAIGLGVGTGDITFYADAATTVANGTDVTPTERARITSTGNFVAGGSVALATTATDGFLYVPTCAGTPTGVPTAITGMAPIVVNTTNNKLYFYSGGAWRDAGP